LWAVDEAVDSAQWSVAETTELHAFGTLVPSMHSTLLRLKEVIVHTGDEGFGSDPAIFCASFRVEHVDRVVAALNRLSVGEKFDGKLKRSVVERLRENGMRSRATSAKNKNVKWTEPDETGMVVWEYNPALDKTKGKRKRENGPNGGRDVTGQQDKGKGKKRRTEEKEEGCSSRDCVAATDRVNVEEEEDFASLSHLIGFSGEEQDSVNVEEEEKDEEEDRNSPPLDPANPFLSPTFPDTDDDLHF